MNFTSSESKLDPVNGSEKNTDPKNIAVLEGFEELVKTKFSSNEISQHKELAEGMT